MLRNKFDVLADLDHLFMLNFSVNAAALESLVPRPLRILTLRERAFPSIVLPRIRNLRPMHVGIPRVGYDLMGLRILVTYESKKFGKIKGIYFKRLIMDPNWVRLCANLVTSFRFERGWIQKVQGDGDQYRLAVQDTGKRDILAADVAVSEDKPQRLTTGSSFLNATEALAMYNDISYGFLPEEASERIRILKIAEPHPNYQAWPLRHLEVQRVHVSFLHDDERLKPTLILEPCYHVGSLPRCWRWLPSEAS
jgi:hypothetical protein